MFKPTLACAVEMDKLVFPVLASPKLDGIRCSIVNGVALTRSLKAIPNKAISAYLSHADFNGVDGELIVGEPAAHDVYNKTVSQVMAHDKGLADVAYYVFDMHNIDAPFTQRYEHLESKITENFGDIPLRLVSQTLIHDANGLLEYEQHVVNIGYEGVMLRSPKAPYKFGRSTAREGYLLKVKRFEDSEAEIIGFEEEMFNGNEAQTNELGRTKRSTAKAGLVGKGTLGALVVKDVGTGVEFAIGTGLTAAQRADIWRRRDDLVGALVKYKFFPVGVKVAPRHPVYLGFRDRRDL